MSATAHGRRLGVDPECVLMLDLHQRVPAVDVERSGLTVIEASNDSVMVAFPSHPEMTEFVRRCEAYRDGPRPGQERAPYEELLDGIERVRPLTVADVLDPALAACHDETLRVDVLAWCPEDSREAERRHEELRPILERAGCDVQDSALSVRAGLSAFRIDAAPTQLPVVADTARVRSIRRRPRPVLGRFATFRASLTDLPAVSGPGPGAPTVGVVDSGIRAGHPLIASALRQATSLGDLPTTDENGHGTLVASLALYGSLETQLRPGARLRPAARLVSVRVLDRDAMFPSADLWERHLEQAITTAADAGARIVVLALGDLRRPYRPPGPVPVAAIVDRIARDRGLVVVISTGNTLDEQFPREDGLNETYPTWLLAEPDASLLPPSMAALALTVGGVVGGHHQGLRPIRDDVHELPLGSPDHPSGHTRCGPGVEQAVKPELCAPAGTPTFLIGQNRVSGDVRTSHIVGAAGGNDADRLLDSASGTSFAAPIVAHAAAGVLSRYPQLSANAVRALVLAGCEDVPEVVEGETRARTLEQQRRLTGHGAVNGERSVHSTDHRAMLLADGEIRVDGVHFYTVPVPRAFFRAREIVVRVALAHDPAVRATRLDYLANRMEAHVYRGVDLDEVRRKYEADSRAEHGSPEDLTRDHLDLQPAGRTSCRSANQCSTVTFRQSWSAALRGTDLVVAVRNTGRWDDEPTQRYALCLMLDTDEEAEPLYNELRARFEVLTEIEPEIES